MLKLIKFRLDETEKCVLSFLRRLVGDEISDDVILAPVEDGVVDDDEVIDDVVTLAVATLLLRRRLVP